MHIEYICQEFLYHLIANNGFAHASKKCMPTKRNQMHISSKFICSTLYNDLAFWHITFIIGIYSYVDLVTIVKE